MTDHPDAVKVLESVLQWAEARCPCENEEPNPCPLCGASVENLEPCKSAENTLPRHLLKELRSVKARAMQAAMPAPAGVRVRKLEWVEPTKLTNGCWSAECELGVFSVAFDDGWHAELNDGRDWEWEPELDPRSYEGPYAAQRACQAYRDARILSAIEDAGAREGAEPQGCPTPGACSCPPSTLTPAGAGDLVERLRKEAHETKIGGPTWGDGSVMDEAASRIEALEAEVAWLTLVKTEMHGAAMDATARATTAEAERDALKAEVERGDVQRVRDLTKHIERADKAEEERDAWRERESETQEALQKIGEEFGVHGGEARTDGVRRILNKYRDALTEIAGAYTAHGYSDAIDAVQALKDTAKEALK